MVFAWRDDFLPITSAKEGFLVVGIFFSGVLVAIALIYLNVDAFVVCVVNDFV